MPLLAGASAAVPHFAKRVFNQIRPDRLTMYGHWRGVPLSGKARDAFPSGHAVHMEAWLRPRPLSRPAGVPSA
jgi:hypothetical protein